MTADSPLSPDVQKKADNRRKRKALLAGGVVLGLGAAVTLAAWSDDVFADGTFNTGTFELQGMTDGTDFADYDGPAASDGSATLEFQLDAAQMAPSQTVFAPLSIATSSTTSLDGTFTLSEVTATGPFDEVLTYAIYSEAASHGASCSPDGAAAGLTEWAGGDAASVSQGGEISGDNSALTVSSSQTDAQHLCIAVTLGASDATAEANQTAVEAAIGESGTVDDTTVTWIFNGQSTDA